MHSSRHGTQDLDLCLQPFTPGYFAGSSSRGSSCSPLSPAGISKQGLALLQGFPCSLLCFQFSWREEGETARQVGPDPGSFGGAGGPVGVGPLVPCTGLVAPHRCSLNPTPSFSPTGCHTHMSYMLHDVSNAHICNTLCKGLCMHSDTSITILYTCACTKYKNLCMQSNTRVCACTLM